jgi:hypothetical protein
LLRKKNQQQTNKKKQQTTTTTTTTTITTTTTTTTTITTTTTKSYQLEPSEKLFELNNKKLKKIHATNYQHDDNPHARGLQFAKVVA